MGLSGKMIEIYILRKYKVFLKQPSALSLRKMKFDLNRRNLYKEIVPKTLTTHS